MKSEVALFKDKRAASAKELLKMFRALGMTDAEIKAAMLKIKSQKETKK